jgi:hypothetical protein
MKEGVAKNNDSLIIPLPSGKKIKLGRLKTSKARFLEAPYS